MLEVSPPPNLGFTEAATICPPSLKSHSFNIHPSYSKAWWLFYPNSTRPYGQLLRINKNKRKKKPDLTYFWDTVILRILTLQQNWVGRLFKCCTYTYISTGCFIATHIWQLKIIGIFLNTLQEELILELELFPCTGDDLSLDLFSLHTQASTMCGTLDIVGLLLSVLVDWNAGSRTPMIGTYFTLLLYTLFLLWWPQFTIIRMVPFYHQQVKK